MTARFSAAATACARRARSLPGSSRYWLLAAAAVACGGSPELYRGGSDVDGGATAPTALPLVEPPPPPPGIHSQYRLEPRHQGVAPPGTQLASPPALVWRSGPWGEGRYNASKSSPAVDAELVYVGQDDGRLYALDRETGAAQWTLATWRHYEELGRADGLYTGIHGSPAFDAVRVYVGDYAGWLYAADKASGQLVWRRQLGGSIGSSPVLYDRAVLIAVEFPEPNGKLFALRARDGQLIYESSFLGHHPHGTVSLAPLAGWLVLGTNAGSCYGLDLRDGAVRWEQHVGGPTKSTAAVSSSLAYVTAWDGRLHAFDLSSGESRFSVPTQGPSMSSPALFEEQACFGSHDTKVRCVDAQSGVLLWEAATEGAVSSSPTIVAESRLLLVGSVDASLYAFDLDDGHVVWRQPLESAVTSVPVAVGRSVFVNDDSGTVWRFDCG